MFADFWTQLVSTNLLSSFELRIIAVLLKQLNFERWMAIDYITIAEKLNLDKAEVLEVIKKLIGYQIIEYKKDSVEQSYYRYRLNSNFGWKKTIDLVFADGIDWQAFLNSFQKLQSEYELAIQAIENKSGNILVVHLEVSALANRTEVEKCLKHRYDLELQALNANYRLEEIRIHQRNSANILNMIELMVNTNRTLHHIADTKPQSESQSKSRPLTADSTLTINESISKAYPAKTKNNPPITTKLKQTLAEAVAEQEKLLKQSDSIKVDNVAYIDDYADTSTKPVSRKRRIKTRLNKHCH